MIGRARGSPVVILGGGISGLVAAAHLSAVQPRPVIVLERSGAPGGAAGSFRAPDGERYPVTYHHVMEGDAPLLRLLSDLGIPYSLRRVQVGALRSGRFKPITGAAGLLRDGALPLRARLGLAAAGAVLLVSSLPLVYGGPALSNAAALRGGNALEDAGQSVSGATAVASLGSLGVSATLLTVGVVREEWGWVAGAGGAYACALGLWTIQHAQLGSARRLVPDAEPAARTMIPLVWGKL